MNIQDSRLHGIVTMIYVNAGPNPLFGGFNSTTSMFGRSSHCWIEGEGMVHALYLTKDSHGSWIVSYRNKYVETESFKLEKQRNRPSFLPAIEGDSTAISAAYFFNLVCTYTLPLTTVLH